MATTITAPAVVTHSGEYDAAQYPQVTVGAALPTIVGTCTTSGGSVKVQITSPESGVDVTVTLTATTTNWTTSGILSFIPLTPGLYTIKVTDVTAAQTATLTVQAFSSPSSG